MVKNNERKKVSFSENDSGFGRYDTFSLASFNEAAREFAAKYGVEEENLSFEFYSREDDYWGSESYLTMSGWRWETDEEFEARLLKDKQDRSDTRRRAAEARQRKKDAEYAEYLKLKEKFEKGE